MIGSAAILIIFLLFLTVGYILSKPKAQINDKDVFADSSNVVDGDDNKAADKKDSVNSNISSIKVEVKGQVKNPGVYELTNGSRIEDLIIKAGGFMPDADIDSIVQVKKLKDEDCIVVKKKGEAGSGNSLASAASSSISSDGKVDINTATKEELDKVSGIGPVTADKIVQYREKNGNYKTIDDLKKIGGIGDKTLEKFKDKLEAR